MQTELALPTAVDRITKDVKRFRILCVGRSGVGKSSIINHVFRIKGADRASVSQYEVGDADINAEFTSSENEFLLLHDSKGFEPAAAGTFDIVSNFIEERRKKDLPLRDQLHAVWWVSLWRQQAELIATRLCTETPRAGGRVFETGEEKILKLARDTQTPIVLVFTKYDRFVRTKKYELRDEPENERLSEHEMDMKSRLEADIALKSYVNVKTVKAAMAGMGYINVSTKQGYGSDISKLVDFTGDVVRDNFTGDSRNTAWLIWAIAQRASLQLKIDAWLTSETMAYYGPPPPGPISDFLAHVHQDIVTFWNFMDEKDILQGEHFMRSILLLVQDAEESRKPHGVPPRAILQISQDLSQVTDIHTPPAEAFVLARDFLDLLAENASEKEAQTQRLLMTYTADLTEVLRSLFDVIVEGDVPATDSEGSQNQGKQERTSWPVLKQAYEKYENEGSRQRIHNRIHEKFKQDQRALTRSDFLDLFSELVKGRGRANN